MTESPRTGIALLAAVVLTTVAGAGLGWQIRRQVPALPGSASSPTGASNEHLPANYDPVHFRPATEAASATRCVTGRCEMLADKAGLG